MKTSELAGALLDYWVARAMGYQTDIKKIKPGGDWCDIEMRNVAPPDFTISGENSACDIAMVPNAIREFPACVIGQKIGRGKHPYRSSWFYPSKVWDHGGPIIERERIQIGPPTQQVHHNGGPNAGWGESGIWSACTWHKGADGKRAIGHDKDSPLVAAMRCYVRSKFGDEVEADPVGAQERKVDGSS